MINQHGSSDLFVEIQTDNPRARAGHVIVDVRATSVNPVDTKIRRGSEGTAGLTFPATLHIDVSGVVSSVGTGVTRFNPGDEVYGCFGGIVGIPGALADQMEVDAQMLALKPKSLSFGEAASLPLVAITAWEALIDRASIKPNDNVLVHGGTGGVGHIGIQLAKVLGPGYRRRFPHRKKRKLPVGWAPMKLFFIIARRLRNTVSESLKERDSIRSSIPWAARSYKTR